MHIARVRSHSIYQAIFSRLYIILLVAWIKVLQLISIRARDISFSLLLTSAKKHIYKLNNDKNHYMIAVLCRSSNYLKMFIINQFEQILLLLLAEIMSSYAGKTET